MRTSRLFAALITLAVMGRFAGAAEDFAAMRGVNYVPSYARNDVAIWMDYDPAVIDRELGYAERLRLNTVRIFLSEPVFEVDPARFLARMEAFLAACARHKLRAMPVLFDSCFDPQAVDLRDYRDKTWIPSPGFPRLGEPDRPAMEAYIRAVVGRFRDDARIALWDVMNEPESTGQYADLEHGGQKRILDFVRWALGRVRQEKPTQPLTVGWAGPGSNVHAFDLVDVISIHLYVPVEQLAREIETAKGWGRREGKPVLLSEFVGQPHQPLEKALPVVSREGVGWMFWELMIGRSQFSEGSAPYQGHVYPDGTCRSAGEITTILHPDGCTGDPRASAAADGFRARSFTDEGITFEGAWQRWEGVGPAGERLWHAGNAGDSATRSVTGPVVHVVLKHGPDCGVARVTIDGQPAPVGEIDTYSKEVDWNRRTEVAKDLVPGPHTVVVTATGAKNPESQFRYVQVVDILALP